MRIDRHLALSLGISRKEAALLIKNGAVAMGGKTVTSKDEQVAGAVTVNGSAANFQQHIHIMMNKPAGYLTAARDKSAKAVMELIDPAHVRRGISPVGRLDKDVTGLLIFTTDGELNHRLTSPNRGALKVYCATVNGLLTQQDVKTFQDGILLSDFAAKPALLEIIGDREGRLTISEGKFHQVKRMFAAVGKPVETLKRVEVAGVFLDEGLSPGETRLLTEEEIDCLYSAVGLANNC